MRGHLSNGQSYSVFTYCVPCLSTNDMGGVQIFGFIYETFMHAIFYSAEETLFFSHGDVIKWKHSPRYWLFLWGIHRSPVNSPHKGQWREDLMFSMICAWISGWVNNRDAGDLRRHHAHYDVIVILILFNTLKPEWNGSFCRRHLLTDFPRIKVFHCD